jgi:hypothetical protein
LHTVIEPTITKQEDADADDAYFTVRWSNLRKADKYDIVKTVPSVSGIFELYYMDEKKKLNLFFFSKAYYGGLRFAIRQYTDTEQERDPVRLRIITDYDVYYRYTISSSYKDMSDVFYFFARTYCPDKMTEDSGRYDNIFVNEITNDKIVTI